MLRARMKAAFKYRDANGAGIAYYRLTDLVRATLEFPTLEGLYAGLAAVVAAFGDGVREMNDRYRAPLAGGYRDLQLVVDHEGHLCEVQLNASAMIRAKRTKGHRDFELVRELGAAVHLGAHAPLPPRRGRDGGLPRARRRPRPLQGRLRRRLPEARRDLRHHCS